MTCTCACTQCVHVPVSIEAPSLLEAVEVEASADGCTQQVIGSLSQPQPIKMALHYFFHSSSQPGSCEGVLSRRPTLYTNVSAGQTALMFEVDLTNSGLDTRQTVYLTSWLLMDGVASRCSMPIPLLKTGLVHILHQWSAFLSLAGT